MGGVQYIFIFVVNLGIGQREQQKRQQIEPYFKGVVPVTFVNSDKFQEESSNLGGLFLGCPSSTIYGCKVLKTTFFSPCDERGILMRTNPPPYS